MIATDHLTRDAEQESLRAEHEALAKRLEIRRSIDLIRRGLYLGFAGLMIGGLALRSAWEKWLAPPEHVAQIPELVFQITAVVGGAATLVALFFVVRGRSLMRGEDEDFNRMRALRARLGLDR